MLGQVASRTFSTSEITSEDATSVDRGAEPCVATASQPHCIASTASIMVVEDEGIVAMDIVDYVEQMGHAVIAVVVSGEDAVQTAWTLRPDLILMDIRLRGKMNGIEATQRIHEHLTIPVVFLTAHADEQTFREIDHVNASGYIQKPFRGQELAQTIDNVLRSSGPGAVEGPK